MVRAWRLCWSWYPAVLDNDDDDNISAPSTLLRFRLAIFKMKTFASTVAVAAALAQCVAGHAMFQQAGADGKDYGTTCARVPVCV